MPTPAPAKLCLALIVASLAAAPALGQSAEQFYKAQKNMTIIVGSAAGGSYDTYARVMGKFLSANLPGNPNFVTSNMPGGRRPCARRTISITSRQRTARP